LREVMQARRGIGTLTVYAFSADNWRRPPDEVSLLMTILSDYLENELARLPRSVGGTGWPTAASRLSGTPKGAPAIVAGSICGWDAGHEVCLLDADPTNMPASDIVAATVAWEPDAVLVRSLRLHNRRKNRASGLGGRDGPLGFDVAEEHRRRPACRQRGRITAIRPGEPPAKSGAEEEAEQPARLRAPPRRS
jgi:hypothetical protein